MKYLISTVKFLEAQAIARKMMLRRNEWTYIEIGTGDNQRLNHIMGRYNKDYLIGYFTIAEIEELTR